MSKDQTPISKYLASLERRQAALSPSPQSTSNSSNPNAIFRKIDFEGDSFLNPDQSVLIVSPPVEALRQGNKRKRLSVLGEAVEEEENKNAKRMHDLERLLQQTQGELIDARAMNTKLEHQINQVNRAHNERILGYERDQNEMRAKMRDAVEKAESFKEQLNKITKKEEDVREKLHQQAEAHFEKMNELDKRVRSLESENLELKGKFESGTLRQSDELRKLCANLEETEMGAEKWVMETQLLRDQLELKDSQLQKYQNELKEAQAIIGKYNELKAKFEESKNDDGNLENLEEKVKFFENLYIKQQTENLRLIQKIEKIGDENRMLRTSMNREMLLEEQISNFEEEIKSLQGALDRKTVVESDNATLRGELAAWKSMAFKLDPDCTNYLKFETYIRKIQNQLLETKHEASTYKLGLNEKDRLVSKLQCEIVDLQEHVKTLCEEKKGLSQELKKTTVHLSLVTKDRDGLKELKESYEQEFEGMLAKPLQTRINQLEETVAEYEAIIHEDPTNKKACAECEKRITLISDIRNEMERIKREKTDIEAQIANMNMTTSAASDDGDTTGVKIVSFGMNPSAMTLEARLKEAINENEQLKEKIKELGDQSVAGPSKESSGGLQELEDKNKTLERKLEILSEAYDFETQQLQLIVNKLCGFHFTLVREPNVQIRLSSVYSTTQNDSFIFQESPNGDMLLLESPILDNFREDIDRFLLGEGSIPGFLSSVTITYVQSRHASVQDAGQLPASQQSSTSQVDDGSGSADTVPVRNPKEIQVEVRRQRHPTSTYDDDDAESDGERDDEEDEEIQDEEGMEEEHEDDENVEEEEHFEEHEEQDDEEYYSDEDDDDGDEADSPIPQNPRLRRILPQPPPQRQAPPRNDDSDDSDVIMIDDD